MINTDWYMIAIPLLLPIIAGSLVAQNNPYYALIIRGILGAIAALTYAIFGAADVALTEALVGTMLSITLYAIAVRSSMTMRLGILETETEKIDADPGILGSIKTCLNPYHLSLEKETYGSPERLDEALKNQTIHSIIYWDQQQSTFILKTRIQRLYQLLQSDQLAETIELVYQENIAPQTTVIYPQSSTFKESQS
jgi:putative multicomponent Na+:H+ antiporter subunit B